MNSIREAISRQLKGYGYTDFELIRVDKSPVMLDGNDNPFYEKRRLLTIFTNRLKGCLLLDPDNKTIDFLKNAITVLESISDDSEIYYWIIDIKGQQISGRSTQERILHIYPDKVKADRGDSGSK